MSTYDPKLIKAAFQTAHLLATAPASFAIGGCMFVPGETDQLLELLAHSHLREKMVQVRDTLNVALGKLTPEEELAVAEDIMRKHIESGYIEGYDCYNGHLFWHPTENNEDEDE